MSFYHYCHISLHFCHTKMFSDVGTRVLHPQAQVDLKSFTFCKICFVLRFDIYHVYVSCDRHIHVHEIHIYTYIYVVFCIIIDSLPARFVCWKQKIIIAYRRFRARLWYLHCSSNGDTGVLCKAIKNHVIAIRDTCLWCYSILCHKLPDKDDELMGCWSCQIQ